MRAQKGSGVIAVLFLSPRRKMDVGRQRQAPAALSPGKKDTVPAVQEAGWASVPVWTGAENLSCT